MKQIAFLWILLVWYAPAMPAMVPRPICVERCAPLLAEACLSPRGRLKLGCVRRMLRQCRHDRACPPVTTTSSTTTSSTTTTTTSSTTSTTVLSCQDTAGLAYYRCCCTPEQFGHDACDFSIDHCLLVTFH